MTPDERKQSQAELLDEYKESVDCLKVLHHKLSESLRQFAVAYATMERVQHVEPISDVCMDNADGFRALLEDYRETYARCVSLREALGAWTSVIADLPYPKR